MLENSGKDQRIERAGRGPLLDLAAPHPIRAMLTTGWPLIAVVLGVTYVCAILFPLLAAPLLIAMPLAVFAAVVVGASRARRIRLTVTDEVVRVSNGKAQIACDRAHVESAVLVESLRRRRLAPSTTDLIFLERNGRSVLLLSGLLWPEAVLQQVLDIVAPATIERVAGRQTPASLAARFPHILDDADGTQRGRSTRDIVLLSVMITVAAVCLVLTFLLLFG